MEGDAAEVGGGGGGAGAEGGDDGATAIPRDARVVKALLKSMGVEDHEACVIQQFLDLWYRYVVDVLSDAQIYSEHASKPAIDADDVKLAIQTKVNASFSQPPPREVLMELTRNRNKIPLPKSIVGPGLPLPPEQDTLISPNYQLLIPKHQFVAQPEEEDDDEDTTTAAATNQPHDQQQQQQQPQQMPAQKVSFPLAGTKRPR